MNKKIELHHLDELLFDGMTIMIGGFMGCGNPHQIINYLSQTKIKDITLICNDGAMLTGPNKEPYYGVSKLIHHNQVKRMIATHVGLNPEIAQKMNTSELEVTLIPQGSFVEMIRAAGSGLGGIITPTGVGTIIEDNPYTHQKITIENKTYLIMKPLHADLALISGYQVDYFGNVWYKGTTRNFSPMMAAAAKTVVVEADHYIPTGTIAPENIVTSGIFIDYIIDGGKNYA